MLTLVRRRRARTRRAPLATTLPLVTLLALTLSPQLAVAQPTPDPTPPPTDEVPAPVDTPDVQEGDETEDGRLFGEPVEVEDDVDEAVREGKPLEEVIAGPYSVQVVAGASLDNGALFGRVGFGWEVTPEVMLGLVAEFNPWYSLDRLAFSLGAFNGYATVGYRWLETELVALHSALGLGVSTLLFDVVSTPAGTVGPFVSLEPVAITIFPRDRLRVLINAGEFAMPAPGIEGTPFLYRQYRVAFGIQYNP